MHGALGFGFNVRLASARSIGGGAAVPMTLNFAYAALSSGFGLYTDTARTANRTYMRATTTAAGTVWAAKIAGSAASLKATSDGGASTGLIEVSVDGGPFTVPTLVAGEFPLFTGLTDAVHTVSFRIGSAYGTTTYLDSSGANILRVVGVSPAVNPTIDWAQLGDARAVTATAVSASSFVPTKFANITSSIARNSVALLVKHNSTEMVVVSASRYITVSIDGGLPTLYDQDASAQGVSSGYMRTTRISGLSGLHTYHVASSTAAGGTDAIVLAVGIVDGTISNIADKRQLDQYGDSITYGVGCSSSGNVDTTLVAPVFGFVAGNFGISGNKTVDVDNRLSAILAAKTITSRDVAVIAIGRNDVGAFGTTQATAYKSIINKLIAKGYGKILCRGILPDSSSTYPTENAAISAAVTAVGDAKAVFVDTSAWTVPATSDGTHPTDAGYITIKGNAVPAYTPLIPA